jgi:hypothetical protein
MAGDRRSCHAAAVRHIVGALALGLAVVLPAPPAGAAPALAAELVQAVLPVTVAQARELAALLRAPGTIAADLVEVTDAVVDVAPRLPSALLHDIATAPIRDWHVLRGVVVDTVELVARPADEPRGLFRHTLRALHRSQTLGAAAELVRRVARPENRTARLAIVLTARAHGVPLRTEHLDLLRRAIDRGDPDVGPLVVAVVEDLVRSYGRDAIRLWLTPG